jgi:S1-C subfamily serine protease
MRRIAPFFLFSFGLAGLASLLAAPGADRSVVEVLVTAQRNDAHVPWRRERPAFRSGYGVAIAPGRIVTVEDLVRNAMLVEIRRPGQSEKRPARILQADPRADAALLAIDGPSDDLPPAEWAGGVTNGTKVRLLQFDPAGQAQSGEGRITEIAVAPLPDAPHSLLAFSVLTDLKLDRAGAPVLCEDRLVGLALRYEAGDQTSVVLPAAVLRRFIDDASHAPYQGVATAGMFWQPLIDPTQRRYFGVDDDNRGVLVVRTVPASGAAGVLEPNDVVVEWDGCAIDLRGYYNDPDFGRLLFSHLIAGRRRPGDRVPVVIVRDGKPRTVEVRLDAFSDARAIIPLNTEGLPVAYLVEGGVILRELTADYLQSYGSRWMLNANPRLVHLYLTRAQFPEKPGDRVVILSGVLPDEINKGYQGYRDDIVTRVNGQPVSNLADVFAVRSRDKGIWRVTTQSQGVDLVLDRDQLDEANRRIADRYRIPQLWVQP